VCHRKHQRADRRDQGACRQQPTRSLGVRQNSGWNLHGHIAVKIKGRQVPQRSGIDVKFFHEFGGDDCRRYPLKKAH
jgi:hypothetical protein